MIDKSDHLISHTKESLGIGFYGGEPLLNFRLIQSCVDYVHNFFPQLEHRINFSLTTNLTVDNGDIINYLVDHGFSVLVSLDGPERVHDRYRRFQSGRGTFQHVMKNLRRMKARNADHYKEKVGFSVVLAPPYDLQAVIDFFQREELAAGRPIMLSFVDSEDTTFFNEFVDLHQINNDLKQQLDCLRGRLEGELRSGTRSADTELLMALFGDKIRDLFQRDLVQLPDKIYPNGICVPGYRRFLLSPEGKFYACEKLGYSMSIGDVDRGFDVDAIYAMIQNYISISESRCLDCWALRLCKMCFLKALKGDQFDIRKKDENCRAVKESIIRALKMFSEIMEANPRILKEIYQTTRSSAGMEVPFRFVQQYRKQTQGLDQLSSV